MVGFHKRRDHPVRVGSAFKQSLAMRLRVRGWTLEEIGLKIDPESSHPSDRAYQLIRAGLNSVRLETAEEMRDLEISRFDLLLRTGFAVLKTAAKRKDARAVSTAMNAIVKVSERRAKLLGLDAPVKYDLLMQETRAMAQSLGINENEFITEMEAVAEKAWANSKK